MPVCQFDRHPEKIVFGNTHVSGIRFFFWDSQFGRFFNTGPIKGKGDPFFYVHTMLWAFLPWSPLVILLVVERIKKFKQRSVRFSRDYICSGIFVTGFILFSLSRFQLPHYLNFLYPFLSIIVANYLIELAPGIYQKIIVYCQNILYVLLVLACMILAIVFGLPQSPFIVFSILVIAMITTRFFPGNKLENIIGRSFSLVLIVNIFLNCLIYPELFKYESGIPAAAYLNQNNQVGPVYTFSEISAEYAFEFYSKQPVMQLKITDLDTIGGNVIVFTPRTEIDSLKQKGFKVEEIKSFPHFHITRLTGTFMNYNTREKVLDTLSLISINRERKI